MFDNTGATAEPVRPLEASAQFISSDSKLVRTPVGSDDGDWEDEPDDDRSAQLSLRGGVIPSSTFSCGWVFFSHLFDKEREG